MVATEADQTHYTVVMFLTYGKAVSQTQVLMWAVGGGGATQHQGKVENKLTTEETGYFGDFCFSATCLLAYILLSVSVALTFDFSTGAI